MCLPVVAEEPGSYDHVIVNDDLDAAYNALKKIVTKVCVYDLFMIPAYFVEFLVKFVEISSCSVLFRAV